MLYIFKLIIIPRIISIYTVVINPLYIYMCVCVSVFESTRLRFYCCRKQETEIFGDLMNYQEN